MNIGDFVNEFSNHPVFFIGTGFSLRYLQNSLSWDGLLRKIAFDIKSNDEFYLDLKSQNETNGIYNYEKIASLLEIEFNNILKNERHGRYSHINDSFYENMDKGVNISRFKLYISEILSDDAKSDKFNDELPELKKARKNIASIITTNYDLLLENVFNFNPLIGNDILLSNPYGSIYKIHGCITQPSKIIITDEDYINFEKKYELIRAQLLSIFIHNPIVFLGYNIGDRNIKDLLKTIFTYVDPLSENAERIRSNFLLVEHDGDSNNIDVVEHDIDLEEFPTIRINKLKTDNFKDLYNSISSLQLKVSAMDIRKVQNIVKDIYTGGSIRVNITEDLDELSNEDKVLVIGSKNTVSYKYHKPQELMKNYFIILEEHNVQILELVDAYSINSNQYFPIFGFDRLNPRIQSSKKLKQQQRNKISLIMGSIPDRCKIEHSTIEDIGKDDEISLSLKINTIFWGIINGNIEIDDAEKYLINFEDKSSTNYRKVLCAFDFKKYGNDDA